jgi:hypothetical protein
MIESVERRAGKMMTVVWQLDKCHDSPGFTTYMS